MVYLTSRGPLYRRLNGPISRSCYHYTNRWCYCYTSWFELIFSLPCNNVPVFAELCLFCVFFFMHYAHVSLACLSSSMTLSHLHQRTKRHGIVCAPKLFSIKTFQQVLQLCGSHFRFYTLACLCATKRL